MFENQPAPDPHDPLELHKCSSEEQRVLFRDLAIALINLPVSAEDRAEFQRYIDQVDREIRGTAECAIWRREEFQRKAAEWHVGPCGGLIEYFPPIADRHDAQLEARDDAERVAAMRWRAEMRARPDIAALIAEGQRAAVDREHRDRAVVGRSAPSGRMQ